MIGDRDDYICHSILFGRTAVRRSVLLSAILYFSLSACGLYVPEKNPLRSDDVVITPGKPAPPSPQGKLESDIIANIRCEIRNGIYRSLFLGTAPWLPTWGTTVTLKLTWDEMANANPGVSILDPLPAAQLFSFSAGLTGGAHATRVETITFTYSNAELLQEQAADLRNNVNTSCSRLQDGTMVESDLKIDQFIYDKASITTRGEETYRPLSVPPFSVFQEDITFVASLGANATPSWKFARITANTSGAFLSATRTHTSDVLITLGPLAKGSAKKEPQLAGQARAQHDAAYAGGSTASSIVSQTP